MLLGLAWVVLPVFSAEGQTRRVLLLGDSWADYIWSNNNWQTPLAEYGLSQWSYEGGNTALGGSTASVWADPGILNLITQELNAYPTIDIIHLSLGGNDMLAGQQLGGWHTGLNSAQESALFDQIQGHIETVVDHILSVRPNVKVGIVDYDYINLWETSLAGLPGAQLLQINLGNPNPERINKAFADMGMRKRAIASSRDRVEYIHNWGLQQFYAGHPGFWDLNFVFRPPFGPQSVAFPGWPPAYSPYPGGSTLYPTPRSRLASGGDDPIHLSNSAYRQLVSNTLGQFFGAWLQDTTGPRVQSIVRAGATPTVEQQLAFTVTFTEAVRTVVPGDFAIEADPAITGASIIGVTGSGSTRTVTVNRGSGAGFLKLNFIDNDTVYDMNWRPAGYDLSTNFDVSFFNGQSYEILSDPPVPVITPGTPSPSLLNAAPFTVVFDKPVTGFTSGDVQLTVNGPGQAAVTGFSGGGANYSFNISATRSGPITVDILIPEGAALDSALQQSVEASFDGFAFDVVTAAQNNPYLSSGVLGPLELSVGDSLELFTGSGPNQPTYALNGGTPVQAELIDVSVGQIVAKYNFTRIDVPAGVAIWVTGDNPLAIAATEDVFWDSEISVSGDLAGRAGGGLGAAPAPGGAGGIGGNGGTGGGTGGAQVSGGAGGNNSNSGFGQPGAGRSNGGPGGNGAAPPGSAAPGGPGIGTTGGSGFPGFGAQGTAGSGGSGGTPGTPNTTANGGSIVSASGGNGGSTDPKPPLPGSENGTPGQNASAVGTNGNPGGTGAAGGDGGDGGDGGNALFTAPANDLSLAAGHGGGAGGGGGGATGGQGGGKGGGGSSGAGGGGGGASCPFCVPSNPYCGNRANGFGGQGGPGGAGGPGGNGGAGGNAPTGSAGGAGGNGGGVLVLAARGLMSFNGTVNISAGPPAPGTPRPDATAGNTGTNPGNNWSTVGLGGAGGTTGVWSWNFGFGCFNNIPTTGGTGGSGTRGGRGGTGGTGGPSGQSGAGGQGGYAVPGMLKLQGSVLLAQGGTVVAENHSGDTANGRIGRYTAISNMASPGLPAFSHAVVSGTTTNDDVLLDAAPYAIALDIPLLPQLAGGVATAGFTAATFWNQGDVTTSGSDLLELVELRGASSPFANFDQIFLVNNGGGDATNVVLHVDGHPDLAIGIVGDGEIWTTTVPAGLSVGFSTALAVTAGPAFSDLYASETLTLSASATGGTGTKTYRWLRGTDEVQTGASDTYTVAATTLADAGVYAVEVTDQASNQVVSLPMTVQVDLPVSITLDPQPATVNVGQSHTFTAAATGGKGVLTYDWQRDAVSLGAPNQPFLPISGATLPDDGTYTVVVSDSLGAAPFGEAVSAPATLTVNDPLLLSGPSGITAYDDTAQVSFSVAVSGGQPTYTYVWHFEGAPLDAGEQPNGPELVLNAPLAGRAGAYSVTVTDSAVPANTLASGTAILQLVPRLDIVTQPVDLALNPGGTGVFAVATTGGIPPLSHVWRRNGTPLPGPQQPNGPVLTLSNVDAGDAGDYDVVVSDSGTETKTSDTAALQVAAVPLSIDLHPQGARGYTAPPLELTAHTLTVSATGGLGSPTYLWLKDGQPAPGVNDTAVYAIDPMTIADSGVYECVVEDLVGPVTSDAALVEVADHMAVTDQPQGGQAAPGSSFTFTITVAGGLGTLDYTWKRADNNKATVVGAGPSLTLSDLEPGDSGDYFCEVSDDFEVVLSEFAALEVSSALPVRSIVGLLALAAALAVLGQVLAGRKRRQGSTE